MVEKACRNCQFIVIEGSTCPNCGGDDLSEKWNNYVYIINPEKSEIAKKIGAKSPGRYALNIK